MGWKSEAFQDGSGDIGFDDLGDAESPAAFRALQDVDVERTPEKLRPRQLGAWQRVRAMNQS